MEIADTPLEGLKIIKPAVYSDDRGYFLETYNCNRLKDHGILNEFVQDNESYSMYGVIRGLHYQLAPYAQAKLVHVVMGSVFDVALDLRAQSPTFGQWYGVELNSDNKWQLFIPAGFAHGFAVLSQNALFAYKCDQVYHRSSERAIRYDDPSLAINWKVIDADRIVSEKDRTAPLFKDAEMNF